MKLIRLLNWTKWKEYRLLAINGHMLLKPNSKNLLLYVIKLKWLMLDDESLTSANLGNDYEYIIK